MCFFLSFLLTFSLFLFSLFLRSFCCCWSKCKYTRIDSIVLNFFRSRYFKVIYVVFFFSLSLFLLAFHISFSVTSAVSWEDWWTYDGISGKLISLYFVNKQFTKRHMYHQIIICTHGKFPSIWENELISTRSATQIGM